LVPQPKGFTVQWFVDGEQTSSLSSEAALPSLQADGEAVIGAQKDFSGTVDLFAVYARDAEGRASVDPALYARSAAKTHGDTLLFAEGFDGVSLPAGFVISGGGEIALGETDLPGGASLTLPPLKTAGEGLEARFTLSPSSSPAAALRLSWEGQQEPFYQASVPARAGEIGFTLGADGVTIRTADGQKTAKKASTVDSAGLVISFSNPKDTKAVLALDKVIVLKSKD
jgi:hypothetical protein